MGPGIPRLNAEVCPSGVRYRVWAPKASALDVRVLDPYGRLLRTVPLQPAGDSYFAGLDPDGATGDLYLFRIDGARCLPDPASRWQPQGVHGPSMVIAPGFFPWTDSNWRRPAFRDLVIYEVHVGAFTKEGSFRSAIDRLEHIRDLGANAIELMPIADFAGGRNWGYDGVYLFAPSHAYGSPDDLRALVDAAHALGLTVIMDVVYNHFGPDGNYLHAYVGDYLDETQKTPWGGAIRYGHPDFQQLRDLVLSNPSYWMHEFHIDGFRLDATHAICDESPRHLLQEITASIRARGGFAIAEDPRNDARLVTPEAEGGYGFGAVWADDFHHVVRVSNTRESEGYLGDFAGDLTETIETLQHGWLYRGQHSKSANQLRGTDCAHLPPERFVHCISNHDQTGNHAFGERLSHRILPTALRAAETLLCLSPYTPMLFMGQEWAASTPFLFFTDHDPQLGKLIIEGRREEFKHFAAFREPAILEKIPNPQALSSYEASKLVWEERDRGAHAQTLLLYKTCLALRASDSAFRPLTRHGWSVAKLSIGVGALHLQSESAEWLVIFDLTGGHGGSLHEDTLLGAGDAWTLILSSNEERFGGDSTCALDLTAMKAGFTAPETLVLRRSRSAEASRAAGHQAQRISPREEAS